MLSMDFVVQTLVILLLFSIAVKLKAILKCSPTGLLENIYLVAIYMIQSVCDEPHGSIEHENNSNSITKSM